MDIHTHHQEIICPIGPGNPRNGEGAIVALRDGRLLLGWSHFTGGKRDHAAAEIWGRISQDGGYTWGEPFTIQENVGLCNVMSVSFLRLRSGKLLLGFLVKNHESLDCRYWVRCSLDEGQSWDDRVLATPEEGYFVVNNDRLIQTSDGRLLIPAAKSADEHHHGLAGCFCSDDEGRTWQRMAEYLDLPESPVGLQEPGIIECADASLWMYMRTDQGCVYASHSKDRGASWSPPQPTELVAPTSPASAKRLPGSGDILILYNDRRGVPFGGDHPSEFHWRTPLTSAVSHDNGRTWHHHQLVESDRTRSYCYTSITFHGDTTLLTYYVGQAGGWNLSDLKLKIVPTAAWTEA